MTAGATHRALFLAHVGALQRPQAAGPGTLACLPGWVTQERTCSPSGKKKSASWGCYLQKQALPLTKLGLVRARGG